jgi:hypothetical protein
LKGLYEDYILNVLKPLSHDELDHYRKFALNILQALLSGKPEQE